MQINLSQMSKKSQWVLGLCVVLILSVCVSMGVYHVRQDAKSHHNNDIALFMPVYQQWTDAFNKGNVEESCAFFSKKLNANIDGIARDYASQCQVFKKVFNQHGKKFQYTFKIRDVYHQKDSRLAAVRVTWFLEMTDQNNNVSKSQEEGIDVLEQSPSGRWEIVNFVAHSFWE